MKNLKLLVLIALGGLTITLEATKKLNTKPVSQPITGKATLTKSTPSSTQEANPILYCVPLNKVILPNSRGGDITIESPKKGKARLMWKNKNVTFSFDSTTVNHQLVPVLEITPTEGKKSTKNYPFESLLTDEQIKFPFAQYPNILSCVQVNITAAAESDDVMKFVNGSLEKVLEKYRLFHIYKGSGNAQEQKNYFAVTSTVNGVTSTTDMKELYKFAQ